MIPEPTPIDPRSADVEAALESLAQGSGVYAIHMQGALPHLSSCAYLRARVKRLIGGTAEGSKQRLRDRLQQIDCWPTGSRLETWLLLLHLAQRWFPHDYDRKLRLRRPWFVGLSSDRFPKLFLSHKLLPEEDPLYGPFASRDAAAAYAESAAGLFQIRKCPDPLQPSPDHPGCIYGEMHQCLRPCQCAVSDEEYASEAARAAEFLQTNGSSTRTSLLLARERASEELDFELAGQLHKRLDRLSTATALREEPAALVQAFHGLAVTRSSQPGAVALWPMRYGTWLAPVAFYAGGVPGESRSMDAALREALAPYWVTPLDPAADRSAHLAILLRWFRSSYRDGDWLPDVAGKGISYRKLVGCISRLMKPDGAANVLR